MQEKRKHIPLHQMTIEAILSLASESETDDKYKRTVGKVEQF